MLGAWDVDPRNSGLRDKRLTEVVTADSRIFLESRPEETGFVAKHIKFISSCQSFLDFEQSFEVQVLSCDQIKKLEAKMVRHISWSCFSEWEAHLFAIPFAMIL